MLASELLNDNHEIRVYAPDEGNVTEGQDWRFPVVDIRFDEATGRQIVGFKIQNRLWTCEIDQRYSEIECVRDELGRIRDQYEIEDILNAIKTKDLEFASMLLDTPETD